jgi:hypothetical protein
VDRAPDPRPNQRIHPKTVERSVLEKKAQQKKEFFFFGTNLKDCVESKGDSGFGFRNKPTVCGIIESQTADADLLFEVFLLPRPDGVSG